MIIINTKNYRPKYKKYNNNPEQQFQKLRLPMGEEVIGRVIKILGATRFDVNCVDEKERICGVPGKFKRRFRIKLNDIVIVKPWVVQSDVRGDIVYRYAFFEINKLREMKKLSI
ncbi:MAG: hypothetical protein QXP35_01480 [Candidatus Micrarchaeaceae archaeon]